MPYAHITGWGMAVPEPIMTNDDLAKFVDTNDQWIRERTGIRERHIAKDTDFTSTIAVDASIRALKVANVRPATNPPDAPPTHPFEMYPSAFLPPFHYVNPVTGQPVTGASQ